MIAYLGKELAGSRGLRDAAAATNEWDKWVLKHVPELVISVITSTFAMHSILYQHC